MIKRTSTLTTFDAVGAIPHSRLEAGHRVLRIRGGRLQVRAELTPASATKGSAVPSPSIMSSVRSGETYASMSPAFRQPSSDLHRLVERAHVSFRMRV